MKKLLIYIFLLTLIIHNSNAEFSLKKIINLNNPWSISFITEDIFKYLTNNNNNLIKYPNPFVIKYDLNPNRLSEFINKYSDIYLFNISNIELEFYNLDLSICRNKINELKNKFRHINKKY